VFGGGTIDKDDELFNDVVLGVTEVILIVFSLALDFLSLTPSEKKKLSKSSKRMKENR